jgi:ABC-type Zn2+ transport system substrate-binding protein/surface adhesin
MYLFEITDKSRRLIYLTEERWKHILRHPNIEQTTIDKIKDTLITPKLITTDNYDESVKSYYKFYKERKEYLTVIVKYLNGKGFIITSFYVNKIK